MQRALVPTGLFVELTEGYEIQVRPRSGLAIKQGITCLNSPGTVDADYRGELKVILINLSGEEQTIHSGDRIAQLVIATVAKAAWQLVDTINETERRSLNNIVTTYPSYFICKYLLIGFTTYMFNH